MKDNHEFVQFAGLFNQSGLALPLGGLFEAFAREVSDSIFNQELLRKRWNKGLDLISHASALRQSSSLPPL